MGHIIYRWSREDILCMGKSEFFLLDHIPGQPGPVYDVMSPVFLPRNGLKLTTDLESNSCLWVKLCTGKYFVTRNPIVMSDFRNFENPDGIMTL